MFGRTLRKIENILVILGGGIAISVLTFLTAVDVIGRYLFNYPIYGAVEISIIGMAFIVYLPLALGQREGGNIRVETILDRATGGSKVYWEIILSFVCLVFFFFWSWRIVLDAISSIRIKQEMMATIYAFPIWPAKIAIAVGMVFLAFRYLVEFISRIMKFKN